ncbi:16S rRNA (uracil1498-N3)-methyltransferase [Christiangramia gaetbulicola]|uniref:Ribosomal RNA small subunit methyltransferase E n=1 Tax=Christiangramia gaetbulicola TaxID=703340 RepID=A0A2T6AGW2_9FLAO|nr:16S rRNA (uracil(1498)-N(3))-methyltransferase [Christiangramia gaetbulicola]PTX43045.1 16S rRNA (uracil1498-N3)-methyltransferase [Christiangramia gaetbulicola]
MQLFFNPEITEKDTQVTFSRDESKHIVKVLRKSEGDILNITNGKGLIFKAEIIIADVKQCTIKIISAEKEPPPPYYLHMIVAPTKMNDRYEWFLEKAMEIGVHEITPIICDHSERKVVKLERYERVLLSAMKQSLHSRFPKLNEPVTFKDFMEKKLHGSKLIAHCEDVMEKPYLQKKVHPWQAVNILIGPEGDFSKEEIDLALKYGWEQISLGDSRLRTETAAIVACHTVAMKNQEL